MREGDSLRGFTPKFLCKYSFFLFSLIHQGLFRHTLRKSSSFIKEKQGRAFSPLNF